jgi:glucokinase
VLGVDVGGSRVKTVVLADGQILARHQGRRDRPIPEILSSLVGSAQNTHRIAAVGVGLAGLVDHRLGRFVWGPHLSDHAVDVSGVLDSLIGSHVVDNDANCAAYAEWATGSAVGHRVALTVSLGTGIGVGLTVDGACWRGSGFAGEAGHMRLTDADLECPCGRSGCWETVVSGRQLGLEAGRLGLDPTAEALVMAAHSGSQSARDALRLAGDWLGVGITNLILMLDPTVVVVAGGVSAAGDLILDATRERIASGLPGAGHRAVVEVAQSTHGRWAGALGAAYLAQRRGSEGSEET